MATDTLMTSVFTGIAFTVAVVVYAVAGGLGLYLAKDGGRTLVMAAFGAGLVGGFALVAVLLRSYAARISARSHNLYRGAWIGAILALVVIVAMYYLPGLAFSAY